MKKYLILLTLISFAQSVFADTLTDQRIQSILSAFNSKPESLIEPLEKSDIEMGAYEGRVVVNKKSKFTYYVHIEDVSSVQSKIVLIPMSTSRFTPTYYQTDEWWDANKEALDKAKREGTPAPKQDMNEVSAWLTEMKLSTNPDVLIIDPVTNKTQFVGLNDYLLDIYLKQFVENGKVVLYRGAEKPGEHESWKRGETPRGVRYWTPTANYAWRYARKNTQFLDLLVKSETPLFRFEIPVADFKAMVQRKWRHLTLGVELTKNAHNIFDRSRFFGDHLYGGTPFLGIGSIGVEFELRANRTGAQSMAKYFVRAATPKDLAQDRARVLKDALTRLEKQRPTEVERLRADFSKRIETVLLEGEILEALQDTKSQADVDALLRQLQIAKKSEIGNIDGVDFNRWAQQKWMLRPVLMCKGLF